MSTVERLVSSLHPIHQICFLLILSFLLPSFLITSPLLPSTVYICFPSLFFTSILPLYSSSFRISFFSFHVTSLYFLTFTCLCFLSFPSSSSFNNIPFLYYIRMTFPNSLPFCYILLIKSSFISLYLLLFTLLYS